MARGARTGKPASIRDPITISTAIAIKNVKTGLSKAATAIDNMAQIGTLLTRSPPVDTDLALSSTPTVSNPSDPSPWQSGSCDRFVVLADGQVRGIGTLHELRARTGKASAKLEDVFLALT